jgi:hypothetical protein
MTAPCNHPTAGTVTSHQHGMSDEQHASTRVCDLPDCIAEAFAWVTRMSHGKPVHHVRDEVAS